MQPIEDPPKSPLKRETSSKFCSPFLRGAKGEQVSVVNIKVIDIRYTSAYTDIIRGHDSIVPLLYKD
jgi:hypothetical protein